MLCRSKLYFFTLVINLIQNIFLILEHHDGRFFFWILRPCRNFHSKEKYPFGKKVLSRWKQRCHESPTLAWRSVSEFNNHAFELQVDYYQAGCKKGKLRNCFFTLYRLRCRHASIILTEKILILEFS